MSPNYESFCMSLPEKSISQELATGYWPLATALLQLITFLIYYPVGDVAGVVGHAFYVFGDEDVGCVLGDVGRVLGHFFLQVGDDVVEGCVDDVIFVFDECRLFFVALLVAVHGEEMAQEGDKHGQANPAVDDRWDAREQFHSRLNEAARARRSDFCHVS